jgi:hypothetical protein
LAREDFIHYQEVAGLNFRDLLSDETDKVKRAQAVLCRKSVLFNETQKLHFGYGFPFIVYTHFLDFFEPVPEHEVELDKIIFASDMCDSLRRRHIALSHAVIPRAIDELYDRQGRPVVIKNLGSGVGLDCLNALMSRPEKVEAVINYDTNEDALQLGEKITHHLESQGKIRPGVVQYIRQSLTKSKEPADLIVKIGIICGLQDFAAAYLMAEARNTLNPGGMLVVSSSNAHMEKTDPLASFLIQHIGTQDDPFKGWGLNFRTRDGFAKLLTDSGFQSFEIHSDAEFPGKESLAAEIRYGVDTLPALVEGHPVNGPLRLPPQEILDRGIGYNWIAVATKVS